MLNPELSPSDEQPPRISTEAESRLSTASFFLFIFFLSSDRGQIIQRSERLGSPAKLPELDHQSQSLRLEWVILD